MRRVDFFRLIWFKNQIERDWFASQFALHYAALRKSVVLYALKRLAKIFKTSLASLEGGIELVVLHETYLCTRKWNWRSFLLPTEINGDPLQIIANDFSYAKEDYLAVSENGQVPMQPLVPLHDHSTVVEYVRFIAAYDAMCWNSDRLRITSVLGSVF